MNLLRLVRSSRTSHPPGELGPDLEAQVGPVGSEGLPRHRSGAFFFFFLFFFLRSSAQGAQHDSQPGSTCAKPSSEARRSTQSSTECKMSLPIWMGECADP
jgi:hypothetical protein